MTSAHLYVAATDHNCDFACLGCGLVPPSYAIDGRFMVGRAVTDLCVSACATCRSKL